MIAAHSITKNEGNNKKSNHWRQNSGKLIK